MKSILLAGASLLALATVASKADAALVTYSYTGAIVSLGRNGGERQQRRAGEQY